MLLLIAGVAYAGGADLYNRPDGLRVLLLPDPAATSVSATMLVGVGEVDDAVGHEGIAHLAEHLWFQADVAGTRVAERLPALGCVDNAFTWLDHTMFETACPPAALDDLLDVELARLTPWHVAPDDLAAERSVVTVEIATRGESRRALSRSIVNALYRADHPAADRLNRPTNHLDDLQVADVEAFVAATYRPERSVLVLAGHFDATAVRARLPAGTGVAPVVPAPPAPPRRTLRPAAHSEPAAVEHPTVVFAWDLPWTRAGGVTRDLLARELNVLLYREVNGDPEVLGWQCGDLAESLVSPFGCEVQLVDGADVAARAEQVRAALPALWGPNDRRLLRPLLAPLASQRTLGGDLAAEDLSVGPSSLAVAAARAVWLSVTFAPAAPPDAATLLELGATDLPPAEVSVIGLQPDASPPEPLAPAAIRAFRPSSPLPPRSTAGAAATRTLANGLTVLAIQRPDTRLYHVALRLLPASEGLEAGAWLAASMGFDSPPPALLADRLVDWGYSRAGLVHSLHTRALTAALDDLTLRALRPRFDLSVYATRTLRWSLQRETDRRDAAWWADIVPWIALHPEDAGWYRLRTLPPPTDAPGLLVAWVKGRLDATMLRLVVVGPDSPTDLLDAVAARLGTWAPTPPDGAPIAAAPSNSGVGGTTRPPALPAPHATWIPGAPGPLANVVVRCPAVDPDGPALAALLAARLQDAEREGRGATYGVTGTVLRGVLTLTAALRPERVQPYLATTAALLHDTSPADIAAWRPVAGTSPAPGLAGWLVTVDWPDDPTVLLGGRTGPVAPALLTDCQQHLQVAVATAAATPFGPDPATGQAFEVVSLSALQAR